MGISASTDKAAAAHAFKNLPEHQQASFKQSYGDFFGVSKKESAKIDYNKLYQASRDNKVKEDPLAKVPDHIKQDPAFKADTKHFFDVKQSETSSVYNNNTAKFFGVDKNAPTQRVDPTKTLGNKFQNVQSNVQPNMESELYK